MKKTASILLALLLLLTCVCFAAADEDAYKTYESPEGYTVMYPADRINAYGVPAEEIGYDADCFEPAAANTGAYMFSCVSQSPDWPDWAGMGYRRQEIDEPDIELEVNMETSYRRYLTADGLQMVDVIRMTRPDGAGDYVFVLGAPVNDPDGWRDELIAVLETVEFPPMGVRAGAFRLDFANEDDEEEEAAYFAEVTVDEEAESVVLTALDKVTGFVLEALAWDDEAMKLADATALYSAAALSPGDSLRICCYFGEILPTLRVRCVNSAGENECWYLADSGMDGSLMLLSEAGVEE